MGRKNQKNIGPEKTPTLDLHGRTRDEVWDEMDRFIHSHSQKGTKRLRIMTGKGAGIVKDEAQRYLKQAGYPFQIEKLPNGKANEGVLLVFVND